MTNSRCPFYGGVRLIEVSVKKESTVVTFAYSRRSFTGHLYKADTSVKRTPRVGPCLSLQLLFDSLQDGHLSKMDT